MANYTNIQSAIDAGTTNMTILRNNSKNDDGTTTYATGIDWFKFNGAIVSNIYSSGNSWIGFGTSSEQLKVNRRDCAVWYEYSETGTIGRCRFYRFRWRGYSYYSTTAANALQEFEFFLFDTGQILLNFITVPTSYTDGANTLVCGSSTVSYSVTYGTPCEYTFTPSDISEGTGWSVGTDRPVTGYYKTSGTAVFSFPYTAVGSDSLYWDAVIPEGTDLKLYTKVNNGAYTQILNSGGTIQGLPDTACTLYVKAELSTTDRLKTPKLKSIHIRNTNDKKTLILSSALPNFSSAIGNIFVVYDGLGGLKGLGGPASAFRGAFTPSGLTWKGNQNDTEHIEVAASANVLLIPITYQSVTSESEHLEVSASAVVTLTDIHDI